MAVESPFLDIYSKLLSDASSFPANLSLNTTRANIFLTQRYTTKRNGDWLASELLEDQLLDYGIRVDDRKNINNFASATFDLASKLRKDCKGWKGSGPVERFKIHDLLSSEDNSDCINPSEDDCTTLLPSSHKLEELRTFLNQSIPDTSKIHSPAHNSYVELSGEQKSSFIHKTPSASLNWPNSSTGAHRKPSTSYGSSGIDASNLGGISGGGIYTSRVGGRFKKWGNIEKDERSVDQLVDNDITRCFDANRGRNSLKSFGRRNNFDESSPDANEQLCTGPAAFKTAGEQLKIESQKKYGNSHGSSFGGKSYDSDENLVNGKYNPAKFIKKSLGGKGIVNSKFVSPLINKSSSVDKRDSDLPSLESQENENVDERLKNIEPRMIELIKNEIMDCGSKITWDDIAGLHFAKTTIQEIVVWPMLRPDIFTGLRRPPKGILLFGPPGTGKTLIGKCIASQSGSTFFSISASSLTSKWIGEGEKMVRALFAVARVHQPAVIFIDEIDSLLSQRSESEHESSRRIKTEFLVQLDGAATDEEDRLLVIGATNRPQELDEAARRRLVKRLYIPLPDLEARKEMVDQLMKCERNELSSQEIGELAKFTEGFSGADMKHLCQEACLGPIRSLGPSQISSIAANQVRPVNMGDFTSALERVHPSVGPDDLHQYVTWNKTYGSGS